ncbi:MAG: MscS family membrane protein [Maribacter sp.]|jgi:MscS family membrane protein
MKKCLFLSIISSLFCLVTFAQEGPIDITLSSPHNTIYNQLYYLQADSYQPDKSALMIYGKSGVEAEGIAIKIKQVFDSKNLYVTISTLPKDSLYQDSLGRHIYYLFPEKLPEINIKKYDNKWYYSEETVELIPLLHGNLYPYGSAILLDIFPQMGTGRFLGIMIWQYIGFGLFLLTGFFLFFLFSKIIDLILLAITKSKIDDQFSDMDLIHKIGKFISFIFIIKLFNLFLPVLQLPIHISSGLYLILDVLKYCFFIYLTLRIFDFLMFFLMKATDKTESRMDDQLLLILKKGVQIAIVIFGIIAILNRLDINVTALIAGVSIGGLAIALAAQDSVKNLIGAFMIFLDRPFDVGDFIIAGSVQGVVQAVGFRSTRLQASDTSIISVPNGKIADEVINNLGRRVYRRYRTQLGIKYDTPSELIELFIEGVQDILRLHPDTLDEKTQVHLNSFGASSLDIFMQTFFTVDSWSEESKGKQMLMLQIIQLAQELDVEFAFPSQSIYMEKGSNENNTTTDDYKKKKDEFIERYKSRIKL